MADQNLDPDMYTKFNSFTSNYQRDTYPALEAALSTASGKYVLITGASQGLGRVMALTWAKAGAAGVAICSRKAETLNPVAKEVKIANPSTEVLAIPCDTTIPYDVANFFQATKQKFGKLDVVIANVGFAEFGNIGQLDEEKWWNVITMNCRSTFLVADNYIRNFGPEPSGTFISMSSSIISVLQPKTSSYGVAKRACIQIVEYLDVEYPTLRAFSLDPGIIKGTAILPPNLVPFAHDTGELNGAFTVWLASGRADKLKGGYLHATWDVEELERHGDEIKEKGLLKTKFLGGILGQPGGCLGK